MNDKQKIKAIERIINYWYQYGCNKSERADGILFAIGAIINTEEPSDDE